jgi:hypothetical protein
MMSLSETQKNVPWHEMILKAAQNEIKREVTPIAPLAFALAVAPVALAFRKQPGAKCSVTDAK